ncbi:putative zinc-binding metallopeptidase [uncultured Thiodictyon sp.]|uniref:zinc-binding metallopeptidase family protein n=1 Tax=uncultured Thiodictyon sp. TaxID=1846217 RepID=UPI0025D7C844|nr:putative zinc-binding metallopeptidase [uncultured Thiodictyon sp.]
MRTFACQACGQAVYFENWRCNQCGATLGFLPDALRLVALQEDADGCWTAAAPSSALHRPGPLARFLSRRPEPPPGDIEGRRYRKCGNYAEHNVCNWMVPAESDEDLCIACRPNRTIPNLGQPGNPQKWYRIERGKRRLVYGLLRLGLPVRSREEDPEHGLAFDFLSAREAPPDRPVLTGHANGLITLNIDEADSAHQERIRVDLNETYRTLVGHFRHEIGHYYWDMLILDGGRIEGFRARFGDERKDYGEALEAHYRHGPPADWQDRTISIYASSHPWEDWAETWAHYLHIADTLETAAHFGIEVEWYLPDGGCRSADPEFDPYTIPAFALIIDNWLPLTFAVNNLNRSMGMQDLYPFVLPQAAIAKLAYVHRVVREAAGRPWA